MSDTKHTTPRAGTAFVESIGGGEDGQFFVTLRYPAGLPASNFLFEASRRETPVRIVPRNGRKEMTGNVE